MWPWDIRPIVCLPALVPLRLPTLLRSIFRSRMTGAGAHSPNPAHGNVAPMPMPMPMLMPMLPATTALSCLFGRPRLALRYYSLPGYQNMLFALVLSPILQKSFGWTPINPGISLLSSHSLLQNNTRLKGGLLSLARAYHEAVRDVLKHERHTAGFGRKEKTSSTWIT